MSSRRSSDKFNEQLKAYKAKHAPHEPRPADTLRRTFDMQASTLITPRLAEEAINSRLTCLPIESLP